MIAFLLIAVLVALLTLILLAVFAPDVDACECPFCEGYDDPTDNWDFPPDGDEDDEPVNWRGSFNGKDGGRD